MADKPAGGRLAAPYLTDRAVPASAKVGATYYGCIGWSTKKAQIFSVAPLGHRWA